MKTESDPAAQRIIPTLFGPGADLDSLPWQPFREGVEIYALYGDRATGPAAALLRYAPGAKLPWHAHAGYEHILVLSGAQRDEYGEKPIGTLAINPPGTSHHVSSPAGCVVLAIWEKPVVFDPGQRDRLTAATSQIKA
jgi:anti-sigma factor ChrR (cupin superfamily)